MKLGYNSIKTLGCGLYVTHGGHESSQGRGDNVGNEHVKSQLAQH